MVDRMETIMSTPLIIIPWDPHREIPKYQSIEEENVLQSYHLQ